MCTECSLEYARKYRRPFGTRLVGLDGLLGSCVVCNSSTAATPRSLACEEHMRVSSVTLATLALRKLELEQLQEAARAEVKP